MCGIAGIVQLRGSINEKVLDAMTDSLSHRGPEERGIWFNESRNVGLGQRRLAIIDLSIGGRQPRVGSDSKIAITFNGEIYNYLELQEELQVLGYRFVSKSDTEVLLTSYLEWGKKCVEHLNGMFAFAIWDGRTSELFAARDQIGEKPFKYYYTDEKIVFGSEVKAILCDETVPRLIDWSAVDMAFSFRYVPSPLTGFKNIHKLPPGHTLCWKAGKIAIERYWNARLVLNENTNVTTEKWWELFVDSVRLRMVSDRPLGAFLSGGIDSTSVVAAMAQNSSRPIETFAFSLGGRSEDLDFASRAAKYYKTSHHEISLATIDYPATIARLAVQYDEPFFDQSALPSLLINEEVKKFATVVLSGDGGDELFGGYKDYVFSRWYYRYSKIPKILKNFLKTAGSFSSKKRYQLEIINKDFFDGYVDHYSLWKGFLPESHFYVTKSDLYLKVVAEQVSQNATTSIMTNWFGQSTGDIANAAMFADINSRLPDGYLAKVDFASMANAVEVRTPFLDKRLVALSQITPSKKKIYGHKTKVIWRNVIAGKVPAEIINRPKRGFAIPLNHIVQNEMRAYINETLLSSDSILQNYFKSATIRKLLADHESKQADYSNHIWSLVMFELWLKTYRAK
jgi:asparagine synthase (glutamine-hydrolysing)